MHPTRQTDLVTVLQPCQRAPTSTQFYRLLAHVTALRKTATTRIVALEQRHGSRPEQVSGPNRAPVARLMRKQLPVRPVRLLVLCVAHFDLIGAISPQ